MRDRALEVAGFVSAYLAMRSTQGMAPEDIEQPEILAAVYDAFPELDSLWKARQTIEREG